MVSAVATQRIASRLKLTPYDHDPGAATAKLVSPDGGTTVRSWPLGDQAFFGMLVRPTVLAGNGIVLAEIVIADDAALATNLIVVKATDAITTTTLHKYVWLECSAEECRQLAEVAGKSPLYIGGRITMADATDEADAIYVGSAFRFEVPPLFQSVTG